MGRCQRPLSRGDDAHVVVGEPTNRHRELYNACRDTIQAIEMVLRPGNTFGDVFDVHSKIMDERGLTRHRLNACGYSLGARFSPSWMEHQMFHMGNPQRSSPTCRCSST
jgi:Xaa-Pro dipeptidase